MRPIAAIVGFALAASASPAPSKTLSWVVQTSQCAHLLTEAYGPDGPEILQQMNTAAVTDINDITAGDTYALPPPSYSDRALVSTREDSQEFLVITSTCDPPVVDSTASHASPSTPTTTGSTTGATPTSTLGTDTSVATSGGESIAETMADAVATTTEASSTTPTNTLGTDTSVATNGGESIAETMADAVATTTEPSTPQATAKDIFVGWLGDICSGCQLYPTGGNPDSALFKCECGSNLDRPNVWGHLTDFVSYDGQLGLSPRGFFTSACGSIDLEQPFKLTATCGEEQKELSLWLNIFNMMNTYAIAVGQNSVGDRFFFLEKVQG